MPAKTWYRLRVNDLMTALERIPHGANKFYRNGETGLTETAELVSPKRQIHRNENTSENTSENYSARAGAVVNGSRKPKRNGEARYSATARDIVARFGDAYLKQFGVPYGRTLRDLQAAESLAGIGAGAATVAEVARAGWTAGKFWGPKMTSVVMLMQRWNEVRAEIAQERPANGVDVWDEIEAATQREMAATNERTA